jgi:23S rRNA pseudouridine1911/1915/1917 synthase
MIMPKPHQKPKPIEVLYEDNHLLVINKPAGLPTQGVAEGVPSVVTSAKAYIRARHRKPGNVYLGVVSRLDSTVSGALVLARTSKAAARLTEQFRSAAVEKTYWALVEQAPQPEAGELSHWLLKDDRAMRMKVVAPRTRGSQHARLSYRTVRQEQSRTLLEIQLHTGRKHQIRLQLASIGCPILGDKKYGSRIAFESGIALHCVRLAIDHPTTQERLTFEAPLPMAWRGW